MAERKDITYELEFAVSYFRLYNTTVQKRQYQTLMFLCKHIFENVSYKGENKNETENIQCLSLQKKTDLSGGIFYDILSF